jgi:hypothetical protein
VSDDDDEEFLSFNNNPVVSQQNSIIEHKEEEVKTSEADKTVDVHEPAIEDVQVVQTVHVEEEQEQKGDVVEAAAETDQTPTNSLVNLSTNEGLNKTEVVDAAQNNSEVKDFNATEVIEKDFNATEVIEKDGDQTRLVLNQTEVIEKSGDRTHLVLNQTEVHENLNQTEVIRTEQQNMNGTVTIDNNQERENLNKTEVVQEKASVLESTFNAEVLEKEEDVMQDITMKSIDETFEEATQEQPPVQIIVEEHPQRFPVHNKFDDFDFAHPTQFPYTKAVAPAEEMFTSASSCEYYHSKIRYVIAHKTSALATTHRSLLLLTNIFKI